jgi:hypothetical protein
MSETAPLTAPAPAAPPVAAPPPVETPAPAAPVTEPDEYSDLAGLDPKWAKEIKDLRKEAGGRRVTQKQYDEAFGAYDQDARDVWLNLATLAAKDPKAGAEALAEVSKLLMDSIAPPPPTVDGEKPMTKAEVKKYFEEQQLEVQTTVESVRIQQEAVAAGYKPDTPEYQALMVRAMNFHNYDLTAAIKADKAAQQKIIDDFVAAKIAAGEKWPVTPAPSGSGAPAASTSEIKDFKQASASLRARLKAETGR